MSGGNLAGITCLEITAPASKQVIRSSREAAPGHIKVYCVVVMLNERLSRSLRYLAPRTQLEAPTLQPVSLPRSLKVSLKSILTR